MNSLKQFVKTYEKWVAANPDTIGDVEVTAKWISYFIAGRVVDSAIVSELIYSLSNMLVFYNDRIIARSQLQTTKNDDKANGSRATKQENAVYRVKVMLTTLECSEVFIEITAKRLFGNKGKWLFIVIIQLTKAIARYFVYKNSTTQIITTPTIPSLDRKGLGKRLKGGAAAGAIKKATTGSATVTLPEEHYFTFNLKRSGRVMRKVEGAPPMQYRDFGFLQQLTRPIQQQHDATTSKNLQLAEYLYIAKPLIHLSAMGLFGEKRWKQYLIALLLDCGSISLYYNNRHLMSKEQKLEMSRRCINLLMYLMRSPFFERYTQSRLDGVLGFVANNVPILKLLAKPVKEYIPHWQSTYFYLWAT